VLLTFLVHHVKGNLDGKEYLKVKYTKKRKHVSGIRSHNAIRRVHSHDSLEKSEISIPRSAYL